MSLNRILILCLVLTTARSAPISVSTFVDDFIGDIEHELKTQLLILRETPRTPTVPMFKLTTWNNGTDDPIVNTTFVSNPELIEAQHLVQVQQQLVAAMAHNVTQTKMNLQAARARIVRMELELASVSAHIIASESMEKKIKEQGNANDVASKVEGAQEEAAAELEQDEKMKVLVLQTKRKVGERTTEYNEALHQVMMDAGAILHQQKDVMHEKKTVLQETADREELPQLVDYVAAITPELAARAANATAQELKVSTRMIKLQADIKETEEEIRILEGGAATGGAATGSGATDSGATGGE